MVTVLKLINRSHFNTNSRQATMRSRALVGYEATIEHELPASSLTSGLRGRNMGTSRETREKTLLWVSIGWHCLNVDFPIIPNIACNFYLDYFLFKGAFVQQW
ncbi:hypothetical protein M514_26700 [Trichuris suis]|uniref:Uncharacterized protein n=1 Tax=Trichuris suis TaxID=68888 RepID=A0A085MV61_9BILA|nr:hypothetical protein M514_26700 [Trichuris suis]